MQIQISKNPEITIGVTRHITPWYVRFALPLSIDCGWSEDMRGSKHISIEIDVLCFHFYIEYWKWVKDIEE